jgi:cyclase
MSATPHLRIFQPRPFLYAYYDGRVPGYRFAEGENWVDDGALELGVASYAIVHGDEAVVYDTHISMAHAQAIKDHLSGLGVRTVTVVLSHWHLDHVAGTEVFQGCRIISNAKTLAHMQMRRGAIESGTESGLPAINPLILPNEVFSGSRSLMLGDLRLELLEFNIHSDDATVIWLPDFGVLLAGDTLEDTITYVAEPTQLGNHLIDLARLSALGAQALYPNHGTAEKIAGAGYASDLIDATMTYVKYLLALEPGQTLPVVRLAELLADDLAAGRISYFAPYERVHERNQMLVLGAV